MNHYLIIYKRDSEPNAFFTSTITAYTITDTLKECSLLEKHSGITITQITLFS